LSPDRQSDEPPSAKPGERPAVIVISSHVARGSVGIRAAGFTLEARGHPVWAVPTVSLPFHPGHGQSARIVPEPEQFRKFLDDLASSPWVNEVAAVLTGYMADAAQAEAVAGFITRLKQENPSLTYLCDPVIGDAGGLYVPIEVALAIRDRLLPLADIATPNLFELAWLAAGDMDAPADLPRAAQMARGLPSTATIVTSAPAFMRGNIASLYCATGQAFAAEHRRIDGAPSGTGDLFSALFLSHTLAGTEPPRALERAAASTFEVIAQSVRAGSDELIAERCIGSLQRPMAMVTMRSLAAAETAPRPA